MTPNQKCLGGALRLLSLPRRSAALEVHASTPPQLRSRTAAARQQLSVSAGQYLCCPIISNRKHNSRFLSLSNTYSAAGFQHALQEMGALPRAQLCQEPALGKDRLCRQPKRTLGKEPLPTAQLSAKPGPRKRPALPRCSRSAKTGSRQRSRARNGIRCRHLCRESRRSALGKEDVFAERLVKLSAKKKDFF